MAPRKQLFLKRRYFYNSFLNAAMMGIITIALIFLVIYLAYITIKDGIDIVRSMVKSYYGKASFQNIVSVNFKIPPSQLFVQIQAKALFI